MLPSTPELAPLWLRLSPPESICLSIDSALTLSLSSATYTQCDESLYNPVAQVMPLSPAHSTHSPLTQLEGWLSLAHTDSTATQSEDRD